MKKRYAALLAVVLAACVLTGCSSGKKKAEETEAVTMGADDISMENEMSEEMSESLEIVETTEAES